MSLSLRLVFNVRLYCALKGKHEISDRSKFLSERTTPKEEMMRNSHASIAVKFSRENCFCAVCFSALRDVLS